MASGFLLLLLLRRLDVGMCGGERPRPLCTSPDCLRRRRSHAIVVVAGLSLTRSALCGGLCYSERWRPRWCELTVWFVAGCYCVRLSGGATCRGRRRGGGVSIVMMHSSPPLHSGWMCVWVCVVWPHIQPLSCALTSSLNIPEHTHTRTQADQKPTPIIPH